MLNIFDFDIRKITVNFSKITTLIKETKVFESL